MADIALITTIEEVKENGVQVNFINEDSRIADMISAQLMFIRPILGRELYLELMEAPGDFQNIMPYIKRALAPLAYWLDLPNLQTQITDKGVATSSSNNMVSSRKWEFEYALEGLEEKGCFHLEELIEFLSTPEITAAYQWSVPEQYNLVFKTGADFNNYFTIYQPYRTFLNLRPFVKQAEDQYLRSTIGEDFFEEMRDLGLPENKKQRTDFQEKQYQGLQLIKKANAFFAIAKAVDQLPVRISTNGMTVALQPDVDKVQSQQAQAPQTQLNNLRTSAQNTGDYYLIKLTEYFDKNASDNLFATYKNSSFYTAPVVADDTDINSTLNIFSL